MKIYNNNERLKRKMKKNNLIKLGVAASILTLTMNPIPILAKTFESSLSIQTTQKKENTPLENNQLAFSFLSHCNKDDLKKWDNFLETMTEKEAHEIKNYMLNNIIKNEKNDYKKAKLIFDWICNNIKYAKLSDTNIGLKPYDVFTKKVAVCGGYSNLYKAMLNLADIPAVVVSGNSSYGAHAWNAMYVNNQWIYSDSTWGNGYFDKNINDFSKDHAIQNIHSATLKGDNKTLIGFSDGIAVIGIENGVVSVDIPEKYKDLEITSISNELFSDHYKIEHLKISSKITKLQTSNASQYLKSIEVDPSNPVYKSIDDVLFTKNLSEILLYPNNKNTDSFIIPKETTRCDFKEIFTNRYLKDIHVENGNTVFSSYDGAVYNHNQTQLLMVPEAKEKISIPGTVQLDNISLKFKEKLSKVILEEGIKSIPYYTFDGCTNLKEIYIPETVKTINIEAFNNIHLKNLTIHGKSGSVAEKFAKDYEIQFIDVDLLTAKEDLEKFIKFCDDLDNNKYIESSWNEFIKVFDNAKTVLNSTNVTKEEVNKIHQSLKNAYSNLKCKPDKEILKNAIDNAEKLNKNDYTQSTWSLFINALTQAKTVLINTEATEQDVNKALDTLNKSIKNLQSIETTVPNETKPNVDVEGNNQDKESNTHIENQNAIVNTGDNTPTSLLTLVVSVFTGIFLHQKKFKNN